MDANKIVDTNAPEVSEEPTMGMVHRVARLTRTLRESMRELGLDSAVQDAAESIPDARDRLRYVGQMTEQAANRVLNAAELVQPLQDEMAEDAKHLAARWDVVDTDGACPKELIADSRQFMMDVSGKTKVTQDNLMEIIMAQDFQDLTGQVVQKLLEVIGLLETELVEVLIESVPIERRKEAETLLNGPAIDKTADNVMADQEDVDDLLSSLGF